MFAFRDCRPHSHRKNDNYTITRQKKIDYIGSNKFNQSKVKCVTSDPGATVPHVTIKICSEHHTLFLARVSLRVWAQYYFWWSTWLTLGTVSHFGFQVCIQARPPHTASCLPSFSSLQCLGVHVSYAVRGLLAVFLVVEQSLLHPKEHNHPPHSTLSPPILLHSSL